MVSGLRRSISKTLRAGISPAAWMLYAKALRGAGLLPEMRHEPNWPPKRIYFAYPYFSVGDLILAIPLLERIHTLWPEAEIDVAMGEPMADVIALLPFIHRVDRMARPGIAKNTVLRDYAEAAAILRQFRRSPAVMLQYDLAIAPRWSDWDGFLSVFQAYLTGAPVRCGYSHRAYGGGPDVDTLLAQAAMGGAGEHESVRYTRLLARCGLEPTGVEEYDPKQGIPALKRIAEERKRAGVARCVDAPEGYAVLSPGAIHGRRMWPLERFTEVARWARQQGWTVVAIGSRDDTELCAALSAEGVQSLAGKTNALEMLDVIAGAKLFLGNDSGPAHIAGSVGVPTVVVSPFPRAFHGEHVNAPSRFRPAGRLVRVLQPEVSRAPCAGPCEQTVAHCILAVTAEEGIEAAKELILKL